MHLDFIAIYFKVNFDPNGQKEITILHRIKGILIFIQTNSSKFENIIWDDVTIFYQNSHKKLKKIVFDFKI